MKIWGAVLLAFGLAWPMRASAQGKGMLVVVSEPPGARIAIDGEAVGRAPTRNRELLPGEHLVVATWADQTTRSVVAHVLADRSTVVRVRHDEPAAAPEPSSPAPPAAMPAAPEPTSAAPATPEAAPEPSMVTPTAPQPAFAPSPGLTLGIGALFSKHDGTTESFAFARYLRAHPLATRCGPLAVHLVDYPTDADFYLSGSVDSSLSYRTKDMTWIWKLGAAAIGAGLVVVVSGIVIASMITRYSDPNNALVGPLIGGGGTVVVGIGLPLTVWGLRWPVRHRYSPSRSSADVVVRYRGVRVAEAKVQHHEAEHSYYSPTPDLQRYQFDPLWGQLAASVSQTASRECAGGTP